MISITDYTDEQVKLCVKNDQIDKKLYQEYGVKRGLSSGKHLTTVWISLPTLQGMSL